MRSNIANKQKYTTKAKAHKSPISCDSISQAYR